MCSGFHIGKVEWGRKLPQLGPGAVQAQVFQHVVWFRLNHCVLTDADLQRADCS